MLAEDDEHVEQEVAEVAGVERSKPVLILGVKLGAAAGGEGFGFAGVDLAGSPAAVLPAVDEPGELPRGPALLVEIGGLDELFEDSKLVVGVEDREVGLQAHQLGMASKHSRRHRVEGAEPGHALDGAAGDLRHALLHLARGLVGEGDGEDLARPRLASGDEVGEARGERRGLSSARAGKDEHRAFGRQHGVALRRVEAAADRRVRTRECGDSGTMAK